MSGQLYSYNNNAALEKMAAQLADKFTGVAEELDRHCTNVNIARVTGGTVGVIGGVLAVVGFAVIPFTAGLSALAVAIGGGIAGSAGGLTAGGAKIFQVVVEKSRCKEVQVLWDEFCRCVVEDLQHNDTEDLARIRQDLQGNLAQMGINASEGLAILGTVAARGGSEAAAAAGQSASTAAATGTAVAAGPAVVAATATGTAGASAAGGGAAATAAGSAAAATTGGAAARLAAAMAAGSVALNVVLVGLSVYDIVDGSLELHRQRGSKAGDAMRKMAFCLEEYALTGRWAARLARRAWIHMGTPAENCLGHRILESPCRQPMTPVCDCHLWIHLGTSGEN